MKVSFVKNNSRYTFHTGDAGTDNFITLVINDLDLTREKVTQIPVRNAPGFAIKVNKKASPQMVALMVLSGLSGNASTKISAWYM